MKKSLEQVLQHPAVWQASRGHRPRRAIATGFPGLDRELHDGGWPEAASTELLTEQTGIGELRLLLPALRRKLVQKPLLAFLAPPHLPYAPALMAEDIDPQNILVVRPRSTREWLWSADQILRSGACGALISWACQTALGDRDLRMLQQAAHQGDCWHALFRHSREALHSSPSALRLTLVPDQENPQRLSVNILKQRGGWGGQCVTIALGHEAQRHPLQAPEALPVHFAQLPSLRRRSPLQPTTVTAIG
mgnify:CR=1 FL=1